MLKALLLTLLLSCAAWAKLSHSELEKGAQIVPVSEHRYHAFIQSSFPFWHTHLCSGAVVSVEHVVTSAHCVTKKVKDGKITGFMVGVVNADKLIRFDAYMVKVHPKYDPHTFKDDIAVIRIKGTFASLIDVKPLRLATKNIIVPAKDKVITTGYHPSWNWVLLKAPQLKRFKFTLRNKSYCKLAHKAELPQATICAGQNAVCQKDEGSPLVYKGKLYGIQSFEGRCPGVYTDIRKVRNFVLAAIG